MLFGGAVEPHGPPRRYRTGREHQEANIIHNDEPSVAAREALHLLVRNMARALKTNDPPHAGAQLPQVNPC